MSTDRCSFTLAAWRGRMIITANYGCGKRSLLSSVDGLGTCCSRAYKPTSRMQNYSPPLAIRTAMAMLWFASNVAVWLKKNTLFMLYFRQNTPQCSVPIS